MVATLAPGELAVSAIWTVPKTEWITRWRMLPLASRKLLQYFSTAFITARARLASGVGSSG